MQQQQKIEDSEFAPSFSYYTSNGITSIAVAKVTSEEKLAQFHDIGDVEGDDFEFSFVFKSDLLGIEDADDKFKAVDDEIDNSTATTGQLGKLNIGKREKSSTYSPKLESGFSTLVANGKKDSSTRSGSKRWIFRYLLRLSNTDGKQPAMLLTSKKVDSPKHERHSGGRWKAETPVHEQFYVQRRAEKEVGKRKTYLPYKKDLVGLFANVNGMGKMLPF